MPTPRPMPLSFGGIVDPQYLVGRERELSALRRAAESTGARLLGDRRFGKTSVLRAAEEQLTRAGYAVVRVSGETNDPARFGEWLAEELRKESLLGLAWKRWAAELGGEVSLHTGVFGFKISGKAASGARVERDLLTLAAEAVRGHGKGRLVLIIDEVTVLASGLEHRQPGSAAEFLRSLRARRQELGNVSMFLAGSVGFHHVLKDLSPVNDLTAVSIGTLTAPDAEYLAACLMLELNIADRGGVAEAISTETAGIPYYVQGLVAGMVADRLTAPSPEKVRAHLDAMLRDPDDPFDIRHYDKRLEPYYGADAALVRRVIDAYADVETNLTVDQLWSSGAAASEDRQPDRDELLDLIGRLERDHVLRRDGDSDRIANELMRHIWKVLRRR